LRTAEEGTGDDEAAAQINREAEEVPQGQQQDRDAQRLRHDPGDPSDDEDPSDDDQSSSDSDDDVSDVDQDDAARPRGRTTTSEPAVGSDITSYSKEVIKYAYDRSRRAAGSVGRSVKQLTGPSIYRQWKENILALLSIEGLMPVIDGICQKPPQGHKLRFKWDAINIRAGQVLLTIVSDAINQDLARHFHCPRYVWKQLNSQYSVSELHIMRDGYEAAIRTRIS
jgi:hypothetical protein